jgi:5-(carboxyamino)imidazole ribonucleotide synthase
MVNLLGDLWQDGEPDWTLVFARPEARLHLYGKAQPRPGRKMGHVLVLDEDPVLALQASEELLARLASTGSRRSVGGEPMTCHG